MDPINTAISGLNAAATRVAVSAGNVANSQSVAAGQNGQPYVPKEVVQQTRAEGGVSTSLRDVSPPSVPVFAPDSPNAGTDGIIQLPNVDLTMETANQILASNTYKANLQIIKAEKENYQTMLDIKG